MIDRLAAALRVSGSDPDWRELADVLWLATAFATGVRAAEPAADEPPVGAADGPPPDTPADSPPQPAAPDAAEPHEPGARVASEGEGGTAAAGAEHEGIDLTVAAPARYALPRRLEIGRALRPFKHLQGAGRRLVLNAEETVDRFCDTDVLVLVLEPDAERWFDVAVVTDSGSTMSVWQDTTAAFADLLERHGGFRRVTRWSLAARPDGLRVVGASGAVYDPRELSDTSGRRIVLVVTDCVDPLWRTDEAWAALRDWGHAGPVALVQTLPARLWHLTAMGDADVEVAARRPGQPNRQLAVVEPWWWPPGAELDSPVPVLTLHDERIGPWARMVTGGGGVTLTAVAAVPPPAEASPAEVSSPGELVETFRVTVSPAAYRLAALLSAVEISLPIARILQEHLMPEARLEDLAEVLAGGVLRSSGGPEPALDFRPGVRELLQASLTTTDVVDVWRAIGPFLEATGRHADFFLILRSAAADETAADGVAADGARETQAGIAAALMRRLGLAPPQRPANGPSLPVEEPLTQLLITIEPYGEGAVAYMEEQPTDPEGRSRPVEIIDLGAEQTDDPLREGRRLFVELTRQPATGLPLRRALATPPGRRCPIWVRERPPLVGRWEALRDDDGKFLALDSRWPITRAAGRREIGEIGEIGPRALIRPLRLVAVLSAGGAGDAGELLALLSALTAPAVTIEVRLHVISGDDGVLQEARNAGPGVTADVIQAGVVGLSGQIEAARPHLLHLFGHHDAVVDAHTVTFANRAGIGSGTGRSSTRIGVRQLRSAVLESDPWLVALTESDSAEAAARLASLGVPAAVGMQGRIDVADANRFTAAFYTELLTMLGRLTDRAGQAELDLSSVMTAPRRVLAGPDPTGSDAWTRPVLFAQPVPFQFFVSARSAKPAAAPLRAQIDTMRELLDRFESADTPTEFLDEIRSRITELEAQLSRRTAEPRDEAAVEVSMNVWTGREIAHGPVAARPGWLDRLDRPGSVPLSPSRADPRAWADAEVGYGVLVPESEASPAEKARGLDLPPPVRMLLDARPGTVLLRWAPNRPDGTVRRYLDDGRAQDLVVGLSPFGVRSGALPRYVVIVAGPAEIPWSVQHLLAINHLVGRLPLAGDALGNYIDAMLDGWSRSRVDIGTPLLWTVDRPGDITARMRATLVDPLAARLAGSVQLTADGALLANLVEALGTARPALVVTSSLGSAVDTEMSRGPDLGLPVDTADELVAPALLERAMPGGAVWYSAAAWSAGSSGRDRYADLFAAGSSAAACLDGVAALGPTVSEAARRLLGRGDPVRAVIGYVEPIFDTALSDPGPGDVNTALAEALATGVLGGEPIGSALGGYGRALTGLYAELAGARERQLAGDRVSSGRLRPLGLAFLSWRSLVLLGDPTVALPGPRTALS